MWEQYAPDPRMRINLGIRRRLAPLLDNDRRKIELANSLLFTLPGAPIVYYGDEIGMGDNLDLFDRNGVRTPMQWDASPQGGFTSGQPFTELVKDDRHYLHVNVAAQMADSNSLFHAISRMVNVRKEHHTFGRGTMTWVESGNPAFATYTRTYQSEHLLIINNLSGVPQTLALPSEHHAEYTDQLSNADYYVGSSLTLEPYAHLWLKRK
jgi:maltose alpha-D-glucosyltransferase / alpha-amylase